MPPLYRGRRHRCDGIGLYLAAMALGCISMAGTMPLLSTTYSPVAGSPTAGVASLDRTAFFFWGGGGGHRNAKPTGSKSQQTEILTVVTALQHTKTLCLGRYPSVRHLKTGHLSAICKPSPILHRGVARVIPVHWVGRSPALRARGPRTLLPCCFILSAAPKRPTCQKTVARGSRDRERQKAQRHPTSPKLNHSHRSNCN